MDLLCSVALSIHATFVSNMHRYDRIMLSNKDDLVDDARAGLLQNLIVSVPMRARKDAVRHLCGCSKCLVQAPYYMKNK